MAVTRKQRGRQVGMVGRGAVALAAYAIAEINDKFRRLGMCEECKSRKTQSLLSLMLWFVGLTMLMVALARWA